MQVTFIATKNLPENFDDSFLQRSPCVVCLKTTGQRRDPRNIETKTGSLRPQWGRYESRLHDLATDLANKRNS